jgi:8-oxo-dGTP pyrophosphatase MutT (NUDIX family)
MHEWKKVNSRVVFDHPRIHLVEDEVILPDGSTTHYLLDVNKKDYVTVIAQIDNKICMIYDYSYPHNQMLLQFPEGACDDDETPEQTAIRELEEETGLRAKAIKIIGKNFDHHRRSTALNYVLLTENAEDTGTTHLGAEESFSEKVLLTEPEISRKIASGEIVQKNALSAWAIYIATKAH